VLFFVLAVLAATPLCAREVKKATPTKIALVTNVQSEDAQNLLALAEVAISSRKDLVLLERSRMYRVLEEHRLSLSGMVDAETALRVGKVFNVDLLAILEGDPKAKQQKTLRLVVFDAKTGVRLLDETLLSKAKKIPATMASLVDAAVEKYCATLKTKKTVSLIGARNVDLPAEKDSLAQVIARLLERSLVNSPDLFLLERSTSSMLTRSDWLAMRRSPITEIHTRHSSSLAMAYIESI
jgi:hypothetical protein